MPTHDRHPDWWRDAVVYQVYPRSWQDGSGDGIGDLIGITQRLDHLLNLGVDVLWISPFYPSPMKDFGYDVCDYRGIDPLFGTMDDFDALLTAVHARGLKLVMDFVPNHSSTEHPWFIESARSRKSSKRDWYVWRDAAADGGPPNNWRSSSGGSAWQWHEPSQQYYLHQFLPEQADLNWRNPELRAAMLDAMRFWFDKGVDGFRLDVVYHCIVDEHFRDDPENPDFDPATQPSFEAVIPTWSTNQPDVMPLVIEPMRRLAERCGNRLLIGEIYLPPEKLVRYYGDSAGSGVQLPFNFQLVFADWRAESLAALIRRYESLIPAGEWPNWVLGNHDQSRIASRVGPERALLAAMLLLTLRGTPTLYQGDELAMQDVEIPPDRIRDPWELNMPGLGEGRDPVRTPMRWDTSAHAGFCPDDVEPWLPIGDRVDTFNVQTQQADPTSPLNLHRRLLAARRSNKALSLGGCRHVEAHGDVLTFVREHAGRRVMVAINLGATSAACPVQRLGAAQTVRVLVGTRSQRDGESIETAAQSAGRVRLAPFEGVVLCR